MKTNPLEELTGGHFITVHKSNSSGQGVEVSPRTELGVLVHYQAVQAPKTSSSCRLASGKSRGLSTFSARCQKFRHLRENHRITAGGPQLPTRKSYQTLNVALQGESSRTPSTSTGSVELAS